MADIKSKVFNLTNNIAKSSGDFVRNTKLNIELANQEEHLKSIYIEVGKKVHEIYSFGGSLGSAFDDLYKDLVVCEGQIRDLKKRIDTVKGVNTCEKCGRNVDRGSEFCPNCGARMYPAAEYSAVAVQAADKAPEITATEQDTAVTEPVHGIKCEEAPAVKKCPVCLSENPEGTKFCLGCGRVIV